MVTSGTYYTTKQNEVLDAICYQHYGRTRTVTEMVLEANPGLAALGPVLPFARKIFLPAFTERTRRKPLVGLWD